MKKRVWIVFLMLLMLCACSDGQKQNTEKIQEKIERKETKETKEQTYLTSYYIEGTKKFTGKQVRLFKKWIQKNRKYQSTISMQAGESLYEESPYDDKGKRKNKTKNYYGAALIRHYVKEYAEGVLDFGESAKTAKNCKKEWSRILSGEVAEKYDCIVVDQKNYNAVKREKLTSQTEGTITYEEGKPPYEYYQFIFYQQIEGIPCMNVGTSMTIKEKKRVANAEEKEAKGRMAKNQDRWELYTLNAGEITVRYNAAGVDVFEANAGLKLGKPCGEAKAVRGEKEILQMAKSALRKKKDIVMEGAELVYCPYFSIEKGKKIRDIVSPFWVVRYYEDGERKQIFYDAYTGVQAAAY